MARRIHVFISHVSVEASLKLEGRRVAVGDTDELAQAHLDGASARDADSLAVGESAQSDAGEHTALAVQGHSDVECAAEADRVLTPDHADDTGQGGATLKNPVAEELVSAEPNCASLSIRQVDVSGASPVPPIFKARL